MIKIKYSLYDFSIAAILSVVFAAAFAYLTVPDGTATQFLLIGVVYLSGLALGHFIGRHY